MKTTKHFAVAALLVLGATLGASTPVRADGTGDLTPTGAEPNAIGQYTLTHVKFINGGGFNYDPGGYELYRGRLTVTCQGLTPGATYATSAGTFKAARDGTGKATASQVNFVYRFEWTWWGAIVIIPPTVSVARVNPDGSMTVVLQAQLPYRP